MSINNKNETTTNSPSDYYKSWIAYEALQEGAKLTNYRSVWKILECSCCTEPHCWAQLPVEPLPLKLHDRIRWYDHCRDSGPSAKTTSQNELTEDDLHCLRNHFVSHHQRIELILVALKPSLEKISALAKEALSNRNGDSADGVSNKELVKEIVQECHYAADGWLAVSILVQGVAKLDRIKYMQYVPRLAGISGGNSPLMMPLTAKTYQMESVHLKHLSDDELAQALLERTPTGRIAEAFIDLLDSVARCWMEHVVTATTSIGLTQGTKGTPNTILVERVLRNLHGSRLLKALGSLRNPNIAAIGIGMEMHQLHDYQSYPLAAHYLDTFADPGSEFGTHSIGYQPKEYELARADFHKIRRSCRTKIWEHFYKDIRPSFCRELGRLLGVTDDFVAAGHVGFGLGSSVTEVLSRLTASIAMLPSNSSDGMQVILLQDEFATLQRTATILARQMRGSITEVESVELLEKLLVSSPTLPTQCTKEHHETDEKKSHEEGDVELIPSNTGMDHVIRQVVFISLVNSCTQQVIDVDWIEHVPLDVVVILDITQAIANLDLDLRGIVMKPNVFLVGSLIKVCTALSSSRCLAILL